MNGRRADIISNSLIMTFHPSALFPQDLFKKKKKKGPSSKGFNVKVRRSDQELGEKRELPQRQHTLRLPSRPGPGLGNCSEGRGNTQLNPASWWFGEGQESRRSAMSWGKLKPCIIKASKKRKKEKPEYANATE